jgi:hypothetical protein
MRKMKMRSNKNSRPGTKVMVLVAACLSTLAVLANTAWAAQRSDDAVRRNGEKSTIADVGGNKTPTPPTRANYLLKAVPLRSTFPPKQQSLIHFGPFVNN